MAENKAVRMATGREVETTEKKGGYPAGDKTTAQMSPPPASWVKPTPDAEPVAGTAPTAGTT